MSFLPHKTILICHVHACIQDTEFLNGQESSFCHGRLGTWWIMLFGFKNFCANFIAAHPGYTIYPVRLNGSAVETFFSQVKHATSGHLSSVNYAQARGHIITCMASYEDIVEITEMHHSSLGSKNWKITPYMRSKKWVKLVNIIHCIKL